MGNVPAHLCVRRGYSLRASLVYVHRRVNGVIAIVTAIGQICQILWGSCTADDLPRHPAAFSWLAVGRKAWRLVLAGCDQAQSITRDWATTRAPDVADQR